MAKGKYQKWLEPEGLILLEGWAREGLTDNELAGAMGINPATLYDWKNKFPEISEALKKGKDVVDFEVESALLKKAMAGDVTAAIFWLKNRKSSKWRDKPSEPGGGKQENNLLTAITESTQEDMDTDDLPEIK